MIALPRIILKAREEKRLLLGHPWVYSNEIDSSKLPSLPSGALVSVCAGNGRFIGNAIYNPHTLIAARVFSRQETVRLDQAFFEERFAKALSFRERLFAGNCYRLIFAEADGIPGMIIDRFIDDFVVQVNIPGMEAFQSAWLNALLAVFPKTQSIILRSDSRRLEQEHLETSTEVLYGERKDTLTVIENGLEFICPAIEGQKTGWFYDHRHHRAALKSYVSGKRVLDVCSYVGGFGVSAAVYGAESVYCVDESAFALEFVLKNAEKHQVESRVQTVEGDAFQVLRDFIKSQQKFDVIILDPPAFAVRRKDIKAATIAYKRLNELAMKLLVPGGILVTASCSMQIDSLAFQGIIQRAAAETRSEWQILARGFQAEDHPVPMVVPEMDYLKTIILRKVS